MSGSTCKMHLHVVSLMSLYKGATTQKTEHSLADAEEHFHNYKQGYHVKVLKYYDEFKALVDAVEQLGGWW